MQAFQSPKVNLEQYTTGVELAATVLHTVRHDTSIHRIMLQVHVHGSCLKMQKSGIWKCDQALTRKLKAFAVLLKPTNKTKLVSLSSQHLCLHPAD